MIIKEIPAINENIWEFLLYEKILSVSNTHFKPNMNSLSQLNN